MKSAILCQYLSSSRRQVSQKAAPETLDEAIASDRSRIIYSAPFKRLQQKAQVYSLESDSGIRSRLTHSLEVGDIARRICQKIVNDDRMEGQFCPNSSISFVTAVENACLLHDIGNPPFGHFGEAAIKAWFSNNTKITGDRSKGNKGKLALAKRFRSDFTEFDGNPHGLRIITRLQTERDEFGLNLTHTAILSVVKYLRAAGDAGDDGLKKKPGYFNTEKSIVDEARSVFKLSDSQRHPVTYLMEVADDISYCMSDIEDGINKGLVSAQVFFAEMNAFELKTKTGFAFLKNGKLDTSPDVSSIRAFFSIKVGYAIHMATTASAVFVDRWTTNTLWKHDELFDGDMPERKLLDALKKFARKHLYSSTEAMNPEIAGYKIIIGILDSYRCVMDLSKDDFWALAVKAVEDPKILKSVGKDYEYRLIRRLPPKHLAAYKYQLTAKVADELSLRCHLIVDYIAGMTDHFALETYQLLHGIKIS